MTHFTQHPISEISNSVEHDRAWTEVSIFWHPFLTSNSLPYWEDSNIRMDYLYTAKRKHTLYHMSVSSFFIIILVVSTFYTWHACTPFTLNELSSASRHSHQKHEKYFDRLYVKEIRKVTDTSHLNFLCNCSFFQIMSANGILFSSSWRIVFLLIRSQRLNYMRKAGQLAEDLLNSLKYLGNRLKETLVSASTTSF